MLKLAVVGKDVSRSLSPAMHTFLLGKMGVPCSYEAVSIPPVQFAARAQAGSKKGAEKECARLFFEKENADS